MIRIKYSTIFIVFFCISYATLYASLDSTFFRDRLSYSGYYATSSFIMLNKAYDISFIKLLTEEPLFLLLNILLTKVFFVSNELLPHVYVFFISFIFSFYIIKKSYNLNFLILSILMLLTVSLSFHAQLVVLRQSLATSILLIFICNKYNLNKLIFISFICALIHNSFFILLLYFLMIRYTNNDIKKK